MQNWTPFVVSKMLQYKTKTVKRSVLLNVGGRGFAMVARQPRPRIHMLLSHSPCLVPNPPFRLQCSLIEIPFLLSSLITRGLKEDLVSPTPKHPLLLEPKLYTSSSWVTRTASLPDDPNTHTSLSVWRNSSSKRLKMGHLDSDLSAESAAILSPLCNSHPLLACQLRSKPQQIQLSGKWRLFYESAILKVICLYQQRAISNWAAGCKDLLTSSFCHSSASTIGWMTGFPTCLSAEAVSLLRITVVWPLHSSSSSRCHLPRLLNITMHTPRPCRPAPPFVWPHPQANLQLICKRNVQLQSVVGLSHSHLALFAAGYNQDVQEEITNWRSPARRPECLWLHSENHFSQGSWWVLIWALWLASFVLKAASCKMLEDACTFLGICGNPITTQ